MCIGLMLPTLDFVSSVPGLLICAVLSKAAAAVQFELDEIQRNRIMVQELA
jgi:hypothetical protein